MSGPWENLPERPRTPPPSSRQMPRPGLYLWLGALAGLGLLLLVLHSLFPGALNSASAADMLQYVGWFALVSSGLLFVRQVNLKQAARMTLAWLGIAGVLLLGYAYRDVIEDAAMRLRGQLVPGYPVAGAPGEMTLAEDEGGSYQVVGRVNGARVRFLIDTGASDIVLTAADARAAGLDPEALDYSRPFATANGIAHGATATVRKLAIGGIVLNDVKVSVQRDELGTSLLGMSFLRRLKSFHFSEHRLTLRW